MSQYYIGIDLGGTYCRVISSTGVHDISLPIPILKKKLVHKHTVEEEIQENLFALIDSVIEQRSEDIIKGIGISIAAPFERKSGVITQWSNRSLWNNFPIMQALKERYSVPVVMEDDANSAALGEHIAGCGKGYTDFLYVTVSTGIGCGIIINNKLLIGNNGQAGNLGHVHVVESEDVFCRCGSIGCLQAMASGPAIVSSFKKTSSYREKYAEVDMPDIKRLANSGNKDAIMCLEKAGKYIGATIGNIALFLDIPLVVLGGGVMNSGDILFNAIQDSCKKSIQKKTNLEIKISKLGDFNGLIGAILNIERFFEKHKEGD